TQALLLYLDRYYGWLSDYTAFAADFPGDTELLDLMATRAFPDMGKSRRAVEAPRPTGAFARIWGLIGDWRIMVFLLFIFAQLGRAIGFKGDSGGQFETAADQELLTGLIMLAMVTVSLVFLFRYLRKTRSQLQSLLICTWCGAGLPILFYAPPTEKGAADRPLVILWLAGSALWLADFWFPKVRPCLTRWIASAFS
ncbi:MAG: hypothetical protein WCS20_13450, partial [Alphaproteobacteria bacterium]